MKRRVFVVAWDRARHVWTLHERSGETTTTYRRKRDAIEAGRFICRELGSPAQLIIKNKNGRIAKEGEHTYPRKSDPHRSKG